MKPIDFVRRDRARLAHLRAAGHEEAMTVNELMERASAQAMAAKVLDRRNADHAA